ncbi:uncharacterized protein LOC135215528 [Macrobrachium nipponense]|uniref:uncharacterized protein LOC135215528 n=1 Tax=Macrobrachium nipponense TaxID=159736 RepID=UPI0030C8C37B
MGNKLSEEPLSIPTLGRPFDLGMLYDCRSHQIVQGITLWDQQTLDGIKVQKLESSNNKIITSDTIKEKSSGLDANIGLKLSFLGGMVGVSGSGEYLDNRKSSNHVERVTLKFHCTTKTETMTMKHLGKGKIEHPEVFDHGTATHVVTGITYGGNAFFVFERELSSNSLDKNVKGNLRAMVNSIPDLKINGEGKLDLSEDEKKESRKFSCSYFGDFILRENPSTFEEAVRLYKEMPNIIGKKGENAVPISACLYPLTKLDSKASKLVREISAVLVKETENYLEDLYKLDVKCNDLLRSQAVNKFHGIEAELQEFKSLLATYKLVFQKEVAKILPSIRGGNKEESELANMLKKRDFSPFRNEALSRWMATKESQVKILLQYTSSLQQIEFVSEPGDLQSKVMSPHHSQVLCFSILIPKSDSHLINMSKYLKEETLNSDLDFTAGNAIIPLRITGNESSMMEKARNFRDFFDNNKENTDVSFLVAEDVSDSNEFQAKTKYYNNGRLLNEDFAIPSSPMKVNVNNIATTHESILVQWEKPLHGASNIDQYKIVCEDTTGNNPPIIQNADSNVTSHHIQGLSPGCEYSVSIQSVCQLGVSVKGQIRGTVETRPTSPPGKPEAWQISSLEIGIKWSKPLHIGSQCTRIKYLVKQQEEGSGWKVVSTLPFENQSINMYVHPNVTYRFKVYCECEQCGKSLDSELSNGLRIEMEEDVVFKSHFCRQSVKIKDGNIKIYQPNLKLVAYDKKYKLQKFEFGNGKDDMPEKVIMLVGSTGSGKTTLINGIINYIFAVKWDDNFRFKLITEPESDNQAKSQTIEVSSYTIHHQECFRIPYSLTIIDTPGIGDVQCIGRDQEITEQIRKFFTTRGVGGVDKIDAVGFVVQSSLPRLTPTQIYIFDQILSLFGKDIADNIFLLLTFADGQKPQVLSGIKEAKIPFRKFFKFNNSALYARCKELERQEQDSGDDEDSTFDTMFWDMGEKSFMKLIEGLNLTQSRSLTLTKEVLEERHRLEVSVTGIQVDIQTGLHKLDQLRNEVEVLKAHEADIDRNKNFTYTVTEETFVKEPIPAGQFITNCLRCHRTCHEHCRIEKDNEKQRCWAIAGENCRICPGRCHWEMHRNIPYKYICKQVEVTKTAEDLRRRYEEATEKKLSAEQLMKEVEEDF